MPIYSMTGFARAQVRVHDQLVYTLSVKKGLIAPFAGKKVQIQGELNSNSITVIAIH